jgi:hypothetical protein
MSFLGLESNMTITEPCYMMQHAPCPKNMMGQLGIPLPFLKIHGGPLKAKQKA